MSYQPPKKKRRWVGPVVVLAVLLTLVVVAFFVAEKLARDAATGVVAQPIRNALGSTAPVEVDLGPGLFLLQAASGSLDHVTVSTSGLPVGEGSADLALVAEGLPLDTAASVDSVDATLTLDATALQSVVPAGSTVSFTDGAFVVASQTDFGAGLTPVELTVVPAASDGVIALEVTAAAVNGSPVDLEDVRNGSYGPVGAALITPAPLCVSTYLPAALLLSSAAVEGDTLVLGFTGTAVKISALSTKGTCPTFGA